MQTTTYGTANAAEITITRTARERVGGRWFDGIHVQTIVQFSDGRTARTSGFAFDAGDARRRIACSFGLRIRDTTIMSRVDLHAVGIGGGR
jgi:hypothetical protein